MTFFTSLNYSFYGPENVIYSYQEITFSITSLWEDNFNLLLLISL